MPRDHIPPLVIIHRNYIPSALPKGTDIAELTASVIGPLTAIVEASGIDQEGPSALRVHLDWIQYKSSFRDPVTARRAVDQQERRLPLTEISIDLRHIDPAALPDQIRAAVDTVTGIPPDADNAPLVLDTFRPWRDAIIWPFNRLFWQQLADWEAYAKRGFEAALPSGGSDANHPDAVKASVEEFCVLLRDLESRGQLPQDIYAMEIGVGSGARARLWLDQFKAHDEESKGGHYSRLKFLLGDYSPATLDTALAAVGPHAPLCSVIPIDATNPFKVLSFLRFKVLFVHLTNVYDNLTFDEIARRDGQLYIVEVRPYVAAGAARQIQDEFGFAAADLPGAIKRLLAYGPDALGDHEIGMAFWTRIWDALRLEERLRAINEGDDAHLPKGTNRSSLDDVLAEAPQDVRFHLSRGAAESFINTAALLHPRGYLQVQDIFVSNIRDYAHGFRGPGKLDGSFVTWVNGAFLHAVGARAGYHVNFAPFPYRAGSKTQILYTTRRD
jgi:hypothetical protein